MFRHFVVKYLSEIGLNCDDCVRTLSVQADIYAVDEAHVLISIRQFDPNSKIQIQSIENGAIGMKVKYPGIFITSSSIVYDGYFGDSPLHHSPKYSRLTTPSE
ncbi:MAG: hypothetical protein A3F94_00520 [Candidatus Spechtbacteria bacterium RIFCSPLOWO2_12_FULL_38_22]|uniref:Uncharacterized protein n=1 Tax=Candidatus Spechtbacteria bacterium RIFCSPLOWO2_12_FULL_38_22 TaxID=1802165 RepID=A0A1G2HG12_9BACT|nr:MAG: hypothetical protein A2728_00675 [Candidatus Spechtbacteria bacterium RIFCSPHIGHO2_01_FULL_38_11]OGZ59511.1 MAG: hypothetical protein A3E58_02445 [Candidatus Spechtbacteria bacterium RIFCSPHIGHO2_12_FULL_38_30]OGZ59806.1 MAG: hypothetical protein A3A00_00120 [Candidatus Spechtbacteria bacterium RIFCSPLOWO2_01_FULL_38_20]OGZ61424.1 MAG: hypothetical protein A3F94_00520 [Candidatus Spechtbacteria bacterium RIFCSPLOWO2_12_FULL_38_22]